VKHITTIGLDIAKQVFQIHGADAEGSPIINRKLRRAEVIWALLTRGGAYRGLEAANITANS
jgi:transposase